MAMSFGVAPTAVMGLWLIAARIHSGVASRSIETDIKVDRKFFHVYRVR
jgi:hypothetical protein